MLVKPAHQIDQLGLGLVHGDLVRDLERDRHDRAGIVGQRRVGQQNQVRPAFETPHDFGGGLLPRELAEEFFDVLNLERALFEVVLRNVIFHELSVRLYRRICGLHGGSDVR